MEKAVRNESKGGRLACRASDLATGLDCCRVDPSTDILVPDLLNVIVFGGVLRQRRDPPRRGISQPTRPIDGGGIVVVAMPFPLILSGLPHRLALKQIIVWIIKQIRLHFADRHVSQRVLPTRMRRL